MNRYRVRWKNGTEQYRDATDLHTLVMAIMLGEARGEPESIKLIGPVDGQA